jgi:hypothetical protein
MNGFTEPRASGASERPDQPYDRVLTWEASAAMLPLVSRIAADVRENQTRLNRLAPEHARLEQRRRLLDWPERARRYQLHEEIAGLEKELADVRAELEVLGLALLDPEAGLIGFPTVVNDRPAFFSWQPNEEAIAFWSFAGDRSRRPVPADWTRPQKERRSKRKSGPQK